jgi:hypothetical protein
MIPGPAKAGHYERAPFVWALVYVALFALVFFKISWSLGDTYSHLAGPALSSWQEAFVDAFTARGREYRPFFTLGIKTAYQAAGTWLPFYQSLVLLLFGALLMLVVWQPAWRSVVSAAFTPRASSSGSGHSTTTQPSW